MNNDHREQAREIVKAVIETLIDFEFNDSDGLRGFNPTGLEYAEDTLTAAITKHSLCSAAALSACDQEIKEAAYHVGVAWNWQDGNHDGPCLVARALWEKVKG